MLIITEAMPLLFFDTLILLMTRKAPINKSYNIDNI